MILEKPRWNLGRVGEEVMKIRGLDFESRDVLLVIKQNTTVGRDWAIYRRFGNFLKPVTIFLAKFGKCGKF